MATGIVDNHNASYYVDWIIGQGATLDTPFEEVFRVALIPARYDLGMCEPYATHYAAWLTRSVIRRIRRKTRLGLPLIQPPPSSPEPKPVKVELGPPSPVCWDVRRNGYDLIRVGHTMHSDRFIDRNDRWEITKSRGRARYTVRRRGEVVGQFKSIDECEDLIFRIAAEQR